MLSIKTLFQIGHFMKVHKNVTGDSGTGIFVTLNRKRILLLVNEAHLGSVL